MNNIEIKVYKYFSDELEFIWKHFETQSQNFIFQSFDWQKLWFKKQVLHSTKIQNYTIIVFKNSKVIMILPLNITAKYGVNILNWSGFPFSDYNAPLVIKNNQINKDDFFLIWKKIKNNKNEFDCIVLENQPEKIVNLENPFFKFLKNKLNNYYYSLYFLNNFRIKKTELDNIKYQTNKLKELGNLQFKIAKKKDEIKKTLDFIIHNKSIQYERTRAWNLFKFNKHREFFITSNEDLIENNVVCYLTLDNKMIAAHSGFQYKQRYYYLFPAYLYEFRKFSPGKILLEKLIHEIKSLSYEYFDLTIGSENYKENFSNNKMPSAYYIESRNLKGLIYILFLKLKNYIKFLKKNYVYS